MSKPARNIAGDDNDNDHRTDGYDVDYEQVAIGIEHARVHGLPEPTPLPHPDDVVLDFAVPKCAMKVRLMSVRKRATTT